MKKINIKSIFTFGIFCINIIFLFYVKIFIAPNTYLSSVKIVYVFVLFPLNIIGGCVSIYILLKNNKSLEKKYLDIVLSLPLLIYVYYFYILPLF